MKKRTQIKTDIPIEDKDRLDGIVKKYRFKSRYQLLQYLVISFLKVADPKKDESVPDEIENMFKLNSELSKDDYDNIKRGVSI